MKYRTKVIEELIKSEEIFTNNLKLIVDKLMEPSKTFLDSSDYENIFKNLPQIAEFNQNLLSTLQKSFLNFDPEKTTIASKVLKLIPFFKIYYIYCDNFDTSNQTLWGMKNDKSKNPMFIKFLEGYEGKEVFKYMDLSSFLVMPVQRLPKYVLLFKDLLKSTENSHPDYNDIEKCLEKFKDINEKNNKVLDMAEKNLKIFQLQKTLGKSKILKILKNRFI